MSNSLQPCDYIAHQTPLSMGFPRQEYWSGLPCLPPGDLPKPGMEPGSPALQVESLPAELPGKSVFILLGYFDNSSSIYSVLSDIPCIEAVHYL